MQKMSQTNSNAILPPILSPKKLRTLESPHSIVSHSERIVDVQGENWNNVEKPSKAGIEAWIQNAIEENTEIILDRDSHEQQQQTDAKAADQSTSQMQENVNKKEVINYVAQRLKQLPIERDERAVLKDIFSKVIGKPSGTVTPSCSKQHGVSIKETECKTTKELLQVAALEHTDAMRQSFRRLAQLCLSDMRNLCGAQNVNRVRSAVFRMRQLNADRHANLLRSHTLKRRQTIMGNAHVRHFPLRTDSGYACYFCQKGFNSVVHLHAHLLTQEHLPISLSTRHAQMLERKRPMRQVVHQQTNNSNISAAKSQTSPFSAPMLYSLVAELKQKDSQIKREDSTVKVMLPTLRCMYCGIYLTEHALAKHPCFKEMSEFLVKEIQHMDINGSPFVCLLCRGMVYDTPAQLQLHLVANHGTDAGLTHCALCEVRFNEPKGNPTDSLRMMSTVYQRHLAEQHLPSLELTEKLFYMGSVLVPKNVVSSAPSDDALYRAYRCVFNQGLPAGQGAPFPFPHWVQDGTNNWISPIRYKEANRKPIAGAFPVVPGSFQYNMKEGRRPSKSRLYRTCLVSPHIIFHHLATRFPKLLSGELSATSQCCAVGRMGDVNSLPLLTAHVLCEHAGNPFTQPGSRELIRAQHAASNVDKKIFPVHHVRQLFEAWMKATQNPEQINDLASILKSKERSIQSWRIQKYGKQRITGHYSKSGRYKDTNQFNAAEENTNRESVYESPSEDNTQKNQKSEPESKKSNPLEKSVAERSEGCTSESSLPRSMQYTKSEFSKRSLRQSWLRPSSSMSYRISRIPVPNWLERNTTSVPNEIHQVLQKALVNQRICCRACSIGPMQNARMLTAHISDEHTKSLEAHMIQLRRSGLFSSLIDPMRTCFQCYTILDDHFAFQIHTIVMHGNRYPLVCGLCIQPLVNLCMADEADQICAQMFEECGVHMDTKKWEKITRTQVKGRTNYKRSASLRFNYSGKGCTETEDEIHAALELDELTAILSSVKSSLSVLRYPPQLVMKAMQMHERAHVQELRKRYLQGSKAINANEQAEIMELHQRCLFQGVSQTMSDQYKELYLLRAEEHERQLQFEQIRFGLDVWDSPPDITANEAFMNEERNTEAQVKTNSSTLSEELRRRFKTLAERSSFDE